jgi:hypothetical protein
MVNTGKQGGSLDGQRRQKESKHVKFLAFTQNVEQVMGMPRLHLRHAIQGSGGQGKSKDKQDSKAGIVGRQERGKTGDDLGMCCSSVGSRGFKARQGVVVAVTARCGAVQAGGRGRCTRQPRHLGVVRRSGAPGVGPNSVSSTRPPRQCSARHQHREARAAPGRRHGNQRII